MIRGIHVPTYECLLIDVNTQRDFCETGGAFPVANVSQLIPQLRRMIAWALRNETPVLSSIDAHRPCELPADRPTCCVDGTDGQRKLDFTLLTSCARVDADNTLIVPLEIFEHYQQVIFRKRTDDLLSNPKVERLCTHLNVGEFFVIGNSLECSVKSLVLGLLARSKKVSVVLDACGFWNKASAELAVRQIAAKGADILTVDAVRSRKLPRKRRYAWARNGWEVADTNGKRGPASDAEPRGRNGNGKKPFDAARWNARSGVWLPVVPKRGRMRRTDGNGSK